MLSDKLRRAREFEERYMPYVPAEERPEFHVTGGIGWINDPNGFSVYKGEYHLFFQYHPYSTKWGPMHWGHVKTRDFIRWERLPVALAPDMEYDKDGCFSGSAVEMPDGRQMLVYTGVRQEREADGQMRDYQTQCLAIGDGVDYEKYPLNPIISGDMLPEGGSPFDFRDPKVWFDGGAYHLVVGNRPADGSGSVLMFKSPDGLEWSYAGLVASCHNQFGRMWECPDLFRLNEKDVLLISAQEMTTVGLEFHPGNGTLCLIGTFDPESCHLVREHVQAIDYGLDFYAPQTLLAPDGRRIMIAWMQNWETSSCQNPEARLFGQMTLPRELAVKDGRLIQNPVRELEAYRGYQVLYRDVRLCGETTLSNVKGRVLDMTVTVRPASEDAAYRHFKLNVAKDGEHATTLRYKPESSTVRIDRTRCGFPHDIVNVRDFSVRPRQGEIKLRVVLDRQSMELFVNDGEQAATSVLYTDISADAISFEADGCVIMDVEKYDLIIDGR